ncbi:UNVERIFIED_CONTAM: hypothetical protein RMT77_013257 [Armadillidium vulgare]
MSNSDPNSDILDVKRLDIAKRQRKALRSHATKSINEIDKIINNPDPNVSKLSTFVDLLEGILTDLNEVNAIIQDSLSDDAFAKDDEECFERQIVITNSIKSTQLFIKNLQGDSNPTSDAPTPATEVPREPEAFKLPTKRLPTFDGDILAFSTFMEIFETNVENKGYSDINKLNLLLDCLKGPALKLVSGYAVTGSNYQVILNDLKRDFGNPAKVKETLISKLLNINPPKYD